MAAARGDPFCKDLLKNKHPAAKNITIEEHKTLSVALVENIGCSKFVFIRKGGFGLVLLCECGLQLVAIKLALSTNEYSSGKESLFRDRHFYTNLSMRNQRDPFSGIEFRLCPKILDGGQMQSGMFAVHLGPGREAVGLAMEYAGTSTADVIAELRSCNIGPDGLHPSEELRTAARTFFQLVANAHKKGFALCDVKPDNFVLCDAPPNYNFHGEGVIKLGGKSKCILMVDGGASQDMKLKYRDGPNKSTSKLFTETQQQSKKFRALRKQEVMLDANASHPVLCAGTHGFRSPSSGSTRSSWEMLCKGDTYSLSLMLLGSMLPETMTPIDIEQKIHKLMASTTSPGHAEELLFKFLTENNSACLIPLQSRLDDLGKFSCDPTWHSLLRFLASTLNNDPMQRLSVKDALQSDFLTTHIPPLSMLRELRDGRGVFIEEQEFDVPTYLDKSGKMTCKACWLRQEEKGLTLYLHSKVSKNDLVAVYGNRLCTGGEEFGICRNHSLSLSHGCLSSAAVFIDSKVNWDNPLKKFIDERKMGGFVNSMNKDCANVSDPSLATFNSEVKKRMNKTLPLDDSLAVGFMLALRDLEAGTEVGWNYKYR